MASLIAVLLFVILSCNTGVYCISGSEFTNSSEEANSTSSTSNSSDTLPVNLEDHKVMHGPKTNTPTLIGSLPEESNGTDRLLARNDSFNESTTTKGYGTILLWHEKPLHNESTTLTESPDYEDDNSTESRFDENGCDRHLRDKHEDECFANFQNSLVETVQIEDEAEKGKHICCASEGYERCCVIGYEEANCVADRKAIKENLKAASMFMSTLSDVSCSKHRGKCGFNLAATRSPLSSFLLVTLGFLPIAFLL
ncbi:hypothetical protein AVEN_256394-1 [Araneus ventricosus]|uniref:Uncharacterized protein n=1 Tax=Araneus ventricosus TaxID=182803 RepID=A0A4Y2FZ74_ARAVE|nr:hypothetical protein AVEN_256394-1 [Araneus ventricosus]